MPTQPTAEELLVDYVKIKGLTTLIEISRDLQGLIRMGLLRQVSGNMNVSEVEFPGAPYSEDNILLEFETIPGGTRYKLSCDVYHGSGGYFGREGIPKPND